MKISLEARVQALEDINEIARLKSRYLDSGDGGWDRPSHDADAVLPLLMDDFSWTGPRFDSMHSAADAEKLWRASRTRIPFAYHLLANPIIDVDGDSASGEWHIMFFATDAGGNELWSAGVYKDRFTRTASGWKIQSVTVRHAFSGHYRDGWSSRTAAVLRDRVEA